MIQPFHLAIPINNLEETREFYGAFLGCQEGRSADKWIDWNFFGHQLSSHVAPDETGSVAKNPVDGQQVPCRHFGIVLTWDQWHELRDRIKDKIDFLINPYIRFEGKIGEQATMFFLDPSGNALEFKSFKNPDQLFAKNGTQK